jgi:Brp/Blh family beta-carotene 15,15'-monooxygenase
MVKIYNLSIVLSFAGLWIASMFSIQVEIMLGFILIFSFGILHGSNDILLINSISNSKLKYPFFKVLGTYVLTVCSAVVLFYFFPLVALLLFIIFSAFHFGEQHWSYREFPISKTIQNGFYFVYGLFILQILFILNIEEVIEVVQSITGYTITEAVIINSFICNVVLFIGLTVYLLFNSKTFKSVIVLELFYLLIFSIIFNASSLIWGFTIYFILWHSIPSLFEQVTFIYGDFNKKNIFNYFKKALPYWLISLVGIAIVYLIFKEEKMFYAIFFSFIAAVTFPHALVINKMFKNKKAQSNK